MDDAPKDVVQYIVQVRVGSIPLRNKRRLHRESISEKALIIVASLKVVLATKAIIHLQ
jgi:hypothetical protein